MIKLYDVACGVEGVTARLAVLWVSQVTQPLSESSGDRSGSHCVAGTHQPHGISTGFKVCSHRVSLYPQGLSSEEPIFSLSFLTQVHPKTLSLAHMTHP